MTLQVRSLETGKTRTIEEKESRQLEIAFSHNQCGCTYYARDKDSGRPWLIIDLVPYGATLDTRRTENAILASLKAAGWNVIANRRVNPAA